MERCRCGTRQAGGIGLPGEVKQLLSGPWRGHQAGRASPQRPAMTVTSSREKRCRYGTRRVGISSAAIRCRRAQPMLTGRLAWPGLPTAPVLPRAALIRSSTSGMPFPVRGEGPGETSVSICGLRCSPLWGPREEERLNPCRNERHRLVCSTKR